MGLRASGACVVALVVALNSHAREPKELLSTDLARAFGSAPFLWNARLSPDGSQLVGIQMHPSGVTYARVFSLQGGPPAVVFSGKRDEYEVTWCDWKGNERVLCGLRGMEPVAGDYRAFTRLVSATANGKEATVLLERRLRNEFAQFQDSIVDWLPNDPDHVLVITPYDQGTGVGRLNVIDGGVSMEDRARPKIYHWISDGHGTPRIRLTEDTRERRWQVRDTPESGWSELHTQQLTDIHDHFWPVGFGEDRNAPLILDVHDGRVAMFAVDLTKAHERQLVYAHTEFDVASVHSLGKFDRIVGVGYVDSRPRVHYFDAQIRVIHESIARTFPDKNVEVLDESWDRRFYLVLVDGATDPGTYYRYDAQSHELGRIAIAYPGLADRQLAPVTHVRYPAQDGTAIPEYLTLPPGHAGPGPAVVLPHGGPSARDYWTFDFLAQYLAAAGYAVLQSNYRGSDGYGVAWLGDGGYRDWRRAIGDITDGTKYLISERIADPERICAVGWSFGGYAALMSAIEHAERYRCVASIAGVTDPSRLAAWQYRFVGGGGRAAFIGFDDEGSPLQRVGSIADPVLLVHAMQDVNVPIEQSRSLARTLDRAGKDVTLIEYAHAEHHIAPERYRIDLLARLGGFLEKNLGPRGVPAAAAE
jgi:dipeptidyl aminopeptidase/acylaminoacyl peptidase